MFIVTRAKIAICIILVAAILIGVIIALADMPVTPISVARTYLHKCGWETEQKPIDVVEIVIPTKWDDVYNQYNKIQKMAGFDFSLYKGKKVMRCTFAIKNFTGKENVRANVYVLHSKVIGGDISTVSINGFMVPLDNRDKILKNNEILEE